MWVFNLYGLSESLDADAIDIVALPMPLPLEVGVGGIVCIAAPAPATVTAVKAWHYVVLVIVYSSKIEYTPAIHRCMGFFRRLMGRVSLAPARSAKVMARDAHGDDADSRGVMLPAVATCINFAIVVTIIPLRVVHPSAPAGCPIVGIMVFEIFFHYPRYPVIDYAVAIVLRVLPGSSFVSQSAPASAAVDNMMPFHCVI